MKVYQLQEVIEQLVEKHPDVELLKNQVGNLAVMHNGGYIGYMDLITGELVLFDED